VGPKHVDDFMKSDMLKSREPPGTAVVSQSLLHSIAAHDWPEPWYTQFAYMGSTATP